MRPDSFVIFSAAAQIFARVFAQNRGKEQSLISKCDPKTDNFCERRLLFTENGQHEVPAPKFGAEVVLIETLSNTSHPLKIWRKECKKSDSLKGSYLRIGLREKKLDWTDVFAQKIVHLFVVIHQIRTQEVIASSSRSLIEKMERNELDLIAVLQPVEKCLVLPPRTKATQPIRVARPVALLAQKEHLEDVFISLLWTSWGAKLVTTLALCVAAFLLSSTVHWWLRPDHHAWTLSDMVLWAVAAIAQQGYTKHPKGLSCRAMFALGYLMANLMYTAFAAAVCSLLATAAETPRWKFRQPVSWKTFQEQGKFIVDASLVHYFIGKRPELVSDTETAAHLVLNNQAKGALSVDVEFARILSSGILGTGTGTDTCRLRVAPLIGSTSPLPISIPYSLVISRNSGVAALFDTWLLRLREFGLLKRFQEIDDVPCDRGFQGGFLNANLHHVRSALFIYLSGVVTSILFLLIEIGTATGWFMLCGLGKAP